MLCRAANQSYRVRSPVYCGLRFRFPLRSIAFISSFTLSDPALSYKAPSSTSSLVSSSHFERSHQLFAPFTYKINYPYPHFVSQLSYTSPLSYSFGIIVNPSELVRATRSVRSPCSCTAYIVALRLVLLCVVHCTV